MVQEPTFVKGTGIYLHRSDGQTFIDAVSGTFNVALGYDHPEVIGAITDQVSKFCHISSHFQKPHLEELLHALIEDAPEDIDDGWFRDITGSTANECAIKIAQKHTEKTDIISFFLSHHGQTIYTTAISGNAFRGQSFSCTTSTNSLKVPPPYCHRCFFNATYPSCGMLCVERINDFIEYSSSGNVAGIIVEPVLANGGNIVPPPGYFEALGKLCEEHDLVLIADEVHTGIGRTGHLYASTTLGIKPDVITLAKGLGGVGIPSAAVLMKNKMNTLKSYEHSFTSGANSVSIAAAKATLRVINNEKILENVRSNEGIFSHLLNELKEKHNCISDIRGLGYMWGVEIIDDTGKPSAALVNQIIKSAFETQNLILRSTRYGFGNVIEVRPPLITTPDQIEEIVFRLSKAIKECTNK